MQWMSCYHMINVSYVGVSYCRRGYLSVAAAAIYMASQASSFNKSQRGKSGWCGCGCGCGCGTSLGLFLPGKGQGDLHCVVFWIGGTFYYQHLYVKKTLFLVDIPFLIPFSTLTSFSMLALQSFSTLTSFSTKMYNSSVW